MVGYHNFTSDEQKQPAGGACKVAILKNFAILEENNCVGVSFQTKLKTLGLQLY